MIHGVFLLLLHLSFPLVTVSTEPRRIFCKGVALYEEFNTLIGAYFDKNFLEPGVIYLTSIPECKGDFIATLTDGAQKNAFEKEIGLIVTEFNQKAMGPAEIANAFLGVTAERNVDKVLFRAHRLVALMRRIRGDHSDPSYQVDYEKIVSFPHRRSLLDTLVASIKLLGRQALKNSSLNLSLTKDLIVDALNLVEKFSLEPYEGILASLNLALEVLNVYVKKCPTKTGVVDNFACGVLPTFLKRYDDIDQVKDALSRIRSLYSAQGLDVHLVDRAKTWEDDLRSVRECGKKHYDSWAGDCLRSIIDDIVGITLDRKNLNYDQQKEAKLEKIKDALDEFKTKQCNPEAVSELVGDLKKMVNQPGICF